MKTILSFSLTLLCCQLMAQSVSIKGSIGKSSNPEIILNLPVDGFYFEAAKDTVTADKVTGNFSVQRNTTKPGFASITHNGHTTFFYLEPGKTYSFTKAAEKRGSLEFIGKEQEAINLFNRIANPMARYRYAAMLDSAAPDPAARAKLVNGFVTTQKDSLLQLNQVGKLDEKLKDVLLDHLDLYSTMVLSNSYYNTIIKDERSNYRQDGENARTDSLSSEMKQKLLQYWGSLHEQTRNKQSWSRFPNFPDLVYYINQYDDLTNKTPADASGKDLTSMTTGIQHWNSLYEKYFRGDAVELLRANNIFRRTEAIPPDEEYIAEYNKFKEQYPKSKLTASLQPSIRKVQQYYQNVATNKKVKYLDNYEQITTFDQLREKLKGKITYIDIWATWCGYCKDEFKYAPQIHSAFKKMKIETLYLSLDNEQANESWIKMVKGMNMGGLNLRAGKALAKDMGKAIPQFVGIPRYIIIGKEGEVLEWDALRPSAGKKLIEQLEKYTKG